MRTSTSSRKTKALLGLPLLLALGIGCEDTIVSGPTCGTGTVLDEESNSCVPENGGMPDFNKTLNDMNIGDVSLTKVEVPDRLTEGAAGNISFTITNNSVKDKPVTIVRMSVARPPNPSMIDLYNQAGYVCTNTCAYANLLNDGICQDGGEGSALSQCMLGTDCADCGPRKGLHIAEGTAEGPCESGLFPEQNTKVCHLATETIALITVEDLKAGTSQEISRTFQMPYFPEKPDKTAVIQPDYKYEIIFSVNEQWMTKDADGFIQVDTAQDRPVGAVDLELADGVVHAGSISIDTAPVGMKFVENSAFIDQYSFELPREPFGQIPIFTVAAKLLSVRAGRTEFIAKLKMPGHDANGNYNSNRSFNLRFPFPGFNNFTTDRFNLPRICDWNQSCGQYNKNDLEMKSWPHGQTANVIFQAFLSPKDRNLLAGTLQHKSANPDLTSKNELHGTLEISTKSEGQTTPSVLKFDVVFMPPPANNNAGWKDPNSPPTTEPTDEIKYASSFPGGTYPEVDNLTPDFFHKIGEDMIGAEVKVSNKTSKERLAQAVVKQAVTLDDYAAINLLGLKLYLIKLSANLDWGTRRMLKDNIAQADVSIIDPGNFTLTSILLNADDPLDNLTKMRSLLKIAFDFENQCEIDDDNPSRETCTVIEEDEGEEEDPPFGISLNTPEPPSFPTGYSYTLSKEKEKELCYMGIICLKGKLEVSLTIGVNGKLEFFRDTTDDPSYKIGLEAKVGPYARADGKASGGLDIRLAAAGFEGNLNFFTADFKPTFIIGLEQEFRPEQDGNEACWMKNNGYIQFLGPVNFKALGGDVRAFVDVGPPPFDVGLFTINLRYRVVDEEIVSWDPPINKTWYLWNEYYPFRGGPGLCEDANTSAFWKSPSSCKTLNGADGYCPGSNAIYNKDKYQASNYHGRFYTGPSQCGTIAVNGNTEMGYESLKGDYLLFGQNVTLMDQTNCQFPYSFDSLIGKFSGIYWGNMLCDKSSFSGTFNDTQFRFCNTSGTDNLRYVDFWLITDDAVSDTGLSLTLTLDDMPEAKFTTDSPWWWAMSSRDKRTDHWYSPDYTGNDFTVPISGTQSDKGATIWGAGRNPYAYFRRVFVAKSENTVARLNCDDSCRVYLDGFEVGIVNWDQWGDVPLHTIPGEVHLLAIESTNTGGPAGARAEICVDQGIYTNKAWSVSRKTPAQDAAGKQWYDLTYSADGDFTAAKEIGPLDTSPWNRSPEDAFNSTDTKNAKWIWASFDNVNSIPGETVYFRYKFTAENPDYAAQVWCDNRCDVYVDGVKKLSHGYWDRPGKFTVTTGVGQEHIIAVQAKNDEKGVAGFVMMMQ